MEEDPKKPLTPQERADLIRQRAAERAEATIARMSAEEAALMHQASMNNRIRSSLKAIRGDE